VVSSASINQRTKLIRCAKPWFNVVIDQFPVIYKVHKLQSMVTTGVFYRVLCKIHKYVWIRAMLESVHSVK
jgi:hypothetical protein